MKLLGWEEADLERAGALWTAREIAQQPECWRQTLVQLERDLPRIRSFLDPLRVHRDLRIILTGAGSSAFIGECLVPQLLREDGRRVEAIATTDLIAAPREYLQAEVPTLLVSFARSGSSPESLAAVEIADHVVKKCHHLIVTCNDQSPLYQFGGQRGNSLALMLPPQTHDSAFAMTSSFSSMLLAARYALDASDERALPVARIAAATERLLQEGEPPLRALAALPYSRVVFLGSAGLRALARESALKLLEWTDGQVIAMYDSPLGFRHGPKAVLTRDTLVIVFVSNDPYTRRYDLDLARELCAEDLVRVLTVSAREEKTLPGKENLYVGGLQDETDDALMLPFLVCAQLYGFQRSLALGNRPDQPSRSGTMSRIVRGVTIYSLPLD